MRRILFSLPFIFLMIMSCGKVGVKFEAFSPEAFAYDIDSVWEVNATVNVRGYEQRENPDDENFTVKLSYSVDIITPSGEKIENIYADKIDLTKHEEIMDIPVETQFNLDRTYAPGKYELIFNIKDNYSDRETSSKTTFDLSK